MLRQRPIIDGLIGVLCRDVRQVRTCLAD
jgi:hypothetical protein